MAAARLCGDLRPIGARCGDGGCAGESCCDSVIDTCLGGGWRYSGTVRAQVGARGGECSQRGGRGRYLRMSVGIESEEDIIADLRQALEATRMELH